MNKRADTPWRRNERQRTPARLERQTAYHFSVSRYVAPDAEHREGQRARSHESRRTRVSTHTTCHFTHKVAPSLFFEIPPTDPFYTTPRSLKPEPYTGLLRAYNPQFSNPPTIPTLTALSGTRSLTELPP